MSLYKAQPSDRKLKSDKNHDELDGAHRRVNVFRAINDTTNPGTVLARPPQTRRLPIPNFTPEELPGVALGSELTSMPLRQKIRSVYTNTGVFPEHSNSVYRSIRWRATFEPKTLPREPVPAWTQATWNGPLPEKSSIAGAGVFQYAQLYQMSPGDTEFDISYKPGGYHPVHVGDTYLQGTYTVIQKLAFDDISTLWLARVKHQSNHVALRIGTATNTIELLNGATLLQQVTDPNNAAEPSRESRYFSPVLKQFTITGPNGRHLCVASPVVGPKLSLVSNCWWRISPVLARGLSLQVAQALTHLHEINVCHGDLNNETVAFTLPKDLDSSHFGTTTRFLLQDEDGKFLEELSKPRYLVKPTVLSDKGKTLIQDQIRLTSLDYAFHMDGTQKYQEDLFHNKAVYVAPEMIFEQRVGAAADVWALGCLIFNMRSGYDLFNDGTDRPHGWEDAMYEMVSVLGHFPKSWPSMEFDEMGFPTGRLQERRGDSGLEPLERPLERCVSSILDPPMKSALPQKFWRHPKLCKSWDIVDEDEVCSTISDEEALLLYDLLSKIFVYNTDKRITMAQVLQHPWFTFSS